jgi:XTP/dITP diphosphohydrolase
LKILVATHNRGKLREYAEMLTDLDISWLTLDDAGIDEEIPETGITFEDNARLKAEGYHRLTGLLTLADDSGLEVDALNKEPGVYSARYGGEGLSDIDRYQLVLSKLNGIPDDLRQARFRCAIAVCTHDGDIQISEGVIEGYIGHEPLGSNGFGYDPIFIAGGYRHTLAELGQEIKNRISHRARALSAIKPILESLLKS